MSGVQSPIRFSLVVGTVGRIDTLERALESFSAQRFQSFEAIIVDQNADDRLAPVLARWTSRMRLVHLHSAPGLSRARNVGIEAASGEIVVFPDDDCWYPEDLLQRVDGWFREHADYSLLSICAKDEKGNEVSSRWPRHSCELDRRSALLSCTSFCLFVRRRTLIAAEGFDPRLGLGSGTRFGSAEDVDLALRVLAQGARGWFEKSIWAGHPAKNASNAPPNRALSYGRGFGCLLRKHNYSAAQWLIHVTRALAGTVRAALLLRWSETRFHWNSFRGRIEGYLAFSDLAAGTDEAAAASTTVSTPE